MVKDIEGRERERERDGREGREREGGRRGEEGRKRGGEKCRKRGRKRREKKKKKKRERNIQLTDGDACSTAEGSLADGGVVHTRGAADHLAHVVAFAASSS